MLDRVLSRCRSLLERARRFERRELRELWAWLETTRNLVHVSALVLVPVLVALVTKLSNVVGVLPFVLFPPLASGTYTLFANPEGRYASPVWFVGGLTGGAVCGGVALWLSTVVTRPAAGTVDGLATTISPVAAAVAVFLTGAVTWAFEVEEPAAFSTALLALVLPTGAGSGATPVTVAGQYALGVAANSTVVAGAFTLWRERFYERRARYLYQSTKGDDHVLVPMRGDHADATAMLGARLAAAHDAGKVVLFDTVDESAIERAADDLRAEGFDDPDAAGQSPESVDDGASLLRSDDDADADSLADLVEPFETETETRVAHAAIEEFLTTTAPQYDLVVIGASRDRSAASRLVSPPTFERIRDLETDVAILDRNYRV